MNYYDLILAKKLGGGGGGGVTVSPLSVSANGTYSAPTGTAYSPVTVSVSGGGADALAERLNNTLSVYSSNDVTNVPSYAFYSAKIKEINLPNALSIGASAFAGCSLLQKVSMASVSTIGQAAFLSCSALSQVYLPIASSIGASVFSACSLLSAVDLPNLMSLGNGAFSRCFALSDVSVPKLKSVPNQGFNTCSELSTLVLPVASSLGSSAFTGCIKLESLYLQSSAVCTIGTNTFNATPIASSSYLGHYGSVFVPSSLLASYQSATNWASISARIVGV